jgi:signal transduction histidine kinase
MKRPWQNWLLMVLCVTIVVPAMCWMTLKALEIDAAQREAQRQTEEARRMEADARRQAELARSQADLARREAELQELISSALWRMDWTLTPLVAQEAARPYFAYSPFFTGTGYVPVGKGQEIGVQQFPSPLLVQPSRYVRLHFQIAHDGTWSSPQNPTGPLCEVAVENGAPFDNIKLSGTLLSQLSKITNRDDLLASLPNQMLPAVEISKAPWNDNPNGLLNNNWTFNYGGQTLQQEVEAFQAGNPGYIEPQQSDVQQQAAINQPLPSQEARQQTTAPNAGITPQTGPGLQSPRLSQYDGNQPNAQASDQLAITREQLKQRGGKELQIRNRAFQSFYQNQIIQQRTNTVAPVSPRKTISEGQCRAVWVGTGTQPSLLLARRVLYNDQVAIQGCWLNWPQIKAMLLEEVVDLFPDAELAPVTSENQVQPGRRLATLPAQLVIPEPTIASTVLQFDFAEPLASADTSLSPLQLSLIVAWICLLIAMLAVAFFVRGVVALSERRGAFVSAVTHELRTPLTTFRMYAEMLSEGMVRKPEQQQKYVDTLRVEADRLYHLVENVLAYARLERGRHGRREQIHVSDLIERVQPRLADRASQSNMKLGIEFDQSVKNSQLFSDPSAIEQILFNLVDNACKYAVNTSDNRINLQVSSTDTWVMFRVRDYGPGILPRDRARLFHPFSKSVDEAAQTAPGVGLGLALCRRLAKALGGRLELEADSFEGASFLLVLPK